MDIHEVMEAEGRERLLAAALTAVLNERGGDEGGSGIVIGVDGAHYIFFTDGAELRMATLGEDELELGTFKIDRGSHTVN